MNEQTRNRGRVALVVAALPVAIVLALVAFAGTDDVGAAGPASSSADRWRRPVAPLRHRHPFMRVVHAELELTRLDGSTATLSVDRGIITRVVDDEIDLVRPDGETVTFTVSATTVIRRNAAPAAFEDLSVGDRAIVLSRTPADGAVRAAGIRTFSAGGAPPR